MSKKKYMIFTVAVALSVATPATAVVMMPDFCPAGKCITFTHSQLLTDVQSLFNQATMIANQASNLSRVGNLPQQQAINKDLDEITGGITAANPLNVANNAAEKILKQVSGSSQIVGAVDSIAHGANGAQQQAQVSNLYLSTIAGETVKANAIAAEEQVQKKNENETKVAALKQLFSGQVSSTVEQP